MNEVWNKCLQLCKPDCNLRQYFVKEKLSSKISYAQTLVYLAHNSMPDVILRHSFEMTLMSFVCNFGGLLGMWLGLSLISISKDIFQFICDFSNRNKIKLFKNNFNLFNKPQILIINSYAPSNQINLPRVEIGL